MSSVLAALRPPRSPAAVFLSLQGRGAAVPPPGDRGTAPCPHGLGEQPEVPQVQPGQARRRQCWEALVRGGPEAGCVGKENF